MSEYLTKIGDGTKDQGVGAKANGMTAIFIGVAILAVLILIIGLIKQSIRSTKN